MSVTQLVLYGVMIVSAIGMLWANQQYNRQGVPWGRPLAGICGIVAFVMAIWAIIYQVNAPKKMVQNIQQKELQYHRIAMKTLGAFLAEEHAGGKILMIAQSVNQFSKDRHDITVASLTEGFAGKLKIVKVEHMESGEEGMGPEGFLLTAKTFDKLVRKYKGKADVILSIIGLPYDYSEMDFWQLAPSKRPKLIVYHANLHDEDIQRAIHRGLITAVLTTHPNASFDPKASVPDDEKEAFDSRFILVHAKNIEKLIEDYPNAFGT